MDSNALDRWITGGRYSSKALVVECPACGEETPVDAETDYGATEYRPEACKCGRAFDGSEAQYPDEPDPDRYEDDR